MSIFSFPLSSSTCIRGRDLVTARQIREKRVALTRRRDFHMAARGRRERTSPLFKPPMWRYYRIYASYIGGGGRVIVNFRAISMRPADIISRCNFAAYNERHCCQSLESRRETSRIPRAHLDLTANISRLPVPSRDLITSLCSESFSARLARENVTRYTFETWNIFFFCNSPFKDMSFCVSLEAQVYVSRRRNFNWTH